jgi:hypothetical protein
MFLPDRVDGVAQCALFEVDQEDVCAFMDESFGCGATDSAGTAGDYGHAAVELTHIQCLRCQSYLVEHRFGDANFRAGLPAVAEL